MRNNESPAQETIPRSPDGRFTVTEGLTTLLDTVAHVARTAAEGGDPTRVSRRTFNETAKRLNSEFKTAQAAEQRTGLRYGVMLTVALADVDERARMLRDDWLRRAAADCPEETMVVFLRACRHAAGDVPSRDDYDTWRLRRRSGRDRRAYMADDLPAASTVVSRFGSWAEALVAAEIIPSVEDLGRRTRRTDADLPAIELLDRYVTEHDQLPTKTGFENWCRNNGWGVSREARRWNELVARLRDRRTEQGLAMPTSAAPTREHDASPAPTVARPNYTHEDMIEALRLYGARYLKGGRPTQADYRRRATQDPELPAASTLTRVGNGTFAEMCREAGL